MKLAADIILIAACMAAFGGARAQSGEAVVKTKCFTCHAVDQKKVGRSFKEIASANKGKAGAEARLVAALKAGKGHAKIQGSDAELKAAVQYVLKQ